ncbi:MAG: nucleotidyltransferase domain-containing protein [Planctomycetaceae bacterium]
MRQELKNLRTLGLVEARESGNRTYYRGNSNHPLYPEIHRLVLKTSGLADVVRNALGDKDIRVAFVFGSVASSSETPNSDIDLMVIGGVSLRQIVERLAGVSANLGREVNPHVLTPAEFARRKAFQDHFVSTVLDAPRLFVIGDANELERLGEEWLAVTSSNQRSGNRRTAVHRQSRS